MNQPLITVLMPVYNAETYLAEAIDSILNQTLTNFELIIIDDGSTDNSQAIVGSYTDPRIRFYQNTANLGISATLNKGIELATTELIARMDADDISYPDRLQQQYRYMVTHPDCALLSAWVRVIDENRQTIRVDRFGAGYHYYNLPFISPMYHPVVMYRRQAVLRVGGYAQQYAEDYALFWELSRYYKIHNLEQVLLDYRITSQSLHLVLRRQEYDAAQKALVLRNIRYYMGEGFQIKPSHLACLSHDFQPLLEENSVQSILACLHQLDLINQQLFVRENVNLDLGTIQQMAADKRAFILSYYGQQLSRSKEVWLFIRTGSWRWLFRLVRSFAKRV